MAQRQVVCSNVSCLPSSMNLMALILVFAHPSRSLSRFFPLSRCCVVPSLADRVSGCKTTSFHPPPATMSMSVHIDACVCIYMHMCEYRCMCVHINAFVCIGRGAQDTEASCALKTHQQEASVLNTHNQQAYTHILVLLYTHPLPPIYASSASYIRILCLPHPHPPLPSPNLCH